MTINIIVNVTKYNGRLAIGSNNELLQIIPEDIMFFKNITTNVKRIGGDDTMNELGKNVVVMGRRTWYSLPQKSRPLKNRLNIVLTNDKELYKKNGLRFNYLCTYKYLKPSDITKDVYFFNMEQFRKFYKYMNIKVFVIGGEKIYKEFFKLYNIQTVYMTEVTDNRMEIVPDTFFEPLDSYYVLKEFSDKKQYKDKSYRFLKYEMTYKVNGEKGYMNLCDEILNNGKERSERTGTGTLSIFGERLEFDISETVPLLTTKRVAWKAVIEELLWFMRGDTDANLLREKGIKIWDGNTSRDFLDKRGLCHYPEGTLGPLYGWQWRFFGAKYSHEFSDTSKHDINKIGGFDQLQYVINEIKRNPTSRRIVMSYWNPVDFDKMVLYPCHFSVEFYVTNDNKLDCLFNMRSSDVFLGLPFNIFSYTVLTYIIALKCDLEPGRLIYIGGDIHIYKNHIEQINKQLDRLVRSSPKLILNDEIKYKDFSEIKIDDFEIIGYNPHPAIRGDMAV